MLSHSSYWIKYHDSRHHCAKFDWRHHLNYFLFEIFSLQNQLSIHCRTEFTKIAHMWTTDGGFPHLDLAIRLVKKVIRRKISFGDAPDDNKTSRKSLFVAMQKLLLKWSTIHGPQMMENTMCVFIINMDGNDQQISTLIILSSFFSNKILNTKQIKFESSIFNAINVVVCEVICQWAGELTKNSIH